MKNQKATSLKNALSDLSQRIFCEHQIPVTFVLISGTRRSYIAGMQPDVPSGAPPEQILLSSSYGMVAPGWFVLPEKVRAAYVAEARAIICAQTDPA